MGPAAQRSDDTQTVAVELLLNKEEEERMVEKADAGEWRWCLLKNTKKKATGNHLSICPRIWLVSQIY